MVFTETKESSDYQASEMCLNCFIFNDRLLLSCYFLRTGRYSQEILIVNLHQNRYNFSLKSGKNKINN